MKFSTSLVIRPWGKIHFFHFSWDNYHIKLHKLVNFLSAFKSYLAKYFRSHLNDPISNTQDL